MDRPPRTLTSISYRNILTAGDDPVEVAFGRSLTLLFGENGSGKSGVFRLLRHLFPGTRSDWHPGRRNGLLKGGVSYTLPSLPAELRHNFDRTVVSEVRFNFHGSWVVEDRMNDESGQHIRANFVTVRWAPETPEDAYRSRVKDKEARLFGTPEATGYDEESYEVEVESDLGSPGSPRLWTLSYLPGHVLIMDGRRRADAEDPWRQGDLPRFGDFAPRVTFETPAAGDGVLDVVLKMATLRCPRFVSAQDLIDFKVSAVSMSGANLGSAAVLGREMERLWKLALPTSPELRASPNPEWQEGDADALPIQELRLFWTLAGHPVAEHCLSLGERKMARLIGEVVRHAATLEPWNETTWPWDPLFIEEPEPHLHPVAQGAFLRLAVGARLDLFEQWNEALSSAIDGEFSTEDDARRQVLSGVREAKELHEAVKFSEGHARLMMGPVVLETHSQALLAAAAQAVTNGMLDPDVDLRICVFEKDAETGCSVASLQPVSRTGGLSLLWPGRGPGPESARE